MVEFIKNFLLGFLILGLMLFGGFVVSLIFEFAPTWVSIVFIMSPFAWFLGACVRSRELF